MSMDPAPMTLEMPCAEAIGWLTERASRSGLSVLRTFDLQDACQSQDACPCPKHAADECDCQMVVLLIYQAQHRPVTLLAHGNNSQTWFSVVNTPEQRASPDVTARIWSLFCM